MHRHDAADAVEARRMKGAAGSGHKLIPRRNARHLLTDLALERRIADDDGPVAMEERYRATLVQRDGVIEILEVAKLDSAEDDAEKLATGAADASRQQQRPRARHAIAHGLADEDAGIVVLAKIAEIIAVGDVDGRR